MVQECPSVHESWAVILETIRFAAEHFQRWKLARMIPFELGDKVIAELKKVVEQYELMAVSKIQVPLIDGIVPVTRTENADISAFRSWKFLEYKIGELKSKRELSLFHFHGLKAEVGERLSAISRRLMDQGIQVSELESAIVVGAELVPDSDSEEPVRLEGPQRTAANTSGSEQSTAFSRGDAPNENRIDGIRPTNSSRRNLLKLLLDPRSIQWLLGIGGGLMVTGLVILLWLNEFFTPPIMAVALGLLNLTVLALGFALIRLTRYQLAGKALTLLACLVMPLNMWYYSANNLIALDGHLWVVAVVISAIYATAAWVLKDEMFVYVFSAGVAMTGLLILADLPPSPQRFWEIPLPATLLVVLGVISIHVERAFSEGDGPYSRKRFGLAYFWSGHVQLAAGLLLVFGAQVSGNWLYEPWFQPLFDAWGTTPSPICGPMRWLALLLVLVATYAYVYSDLFVRRAGFYIHIASFTLLWAELLIVEMLDIAMGVDAVIIVLAVTSLVVHVLQATLTGDNEYTRSFPVFGLLLGLLPVLIGGFVYFQHMGPRTIWAEHDPNWTFVAAMLLTAFSSRVGAFVYQNISKSLSTSYFFASGASLMVAAATALAALGGERWEEHAPILMLIPIAYLIAARLYGDRVPAQALRWVAYAATFAMLASSSITAFEGFTRLQRLGPLNLSLAIFFLEAAIFFGLATWMQKQPIFVYLTTLMASACVWQLLAYSRVGAQGLILAFALIGLCLNIAYLMSFWEKTAAAKLAEPFFMAANTLLSLAFVSSVFHSLSRIISRTLEATKSELNWMFVGFCAAMCMVSVFTFTMTQHRDWRRWYMVTTLAEAGVTLFALHTLIHLNPWQQLELFSVLAGFVLLLIGHVGWYRETDRESDVVSTSLFVGALLATWPLAIATWYDRYQGEFRMVNELGFLFVSVLLLATGSVFQLKSTTLVGGVMTALYFLTLLIRVPWSQLNSVAVALSVGGAILFGLGLLLAFFRDRLLTLPDQIKKRQGLFRILNWR